MATSKKTASSRDSVGTAADRTETIVPKLVPSEAAANRAMADASDLANPDSRAYRTRARILDATARELREKGFVGTRLIHIAKAADIKAGAIYYYFHSLEAVIEEVIELGQRSVIEEVGAALRALPDDTSAIDRILTAVAVHLETVLTRSLYAQASMRNLSQLPPAMRDRQLLLRRQYGEMWRDLFDLGVEQGEFDADFDALTARMLTIGALNWTLEWWDESRGSLESIVTMSQDFVRKAISPTR